MRITNIASGIWRDEDGKVYVEVGPGILDDQCPQAISSTEGYRELNHV